MPYWPQLSYCLSFQTRIRAYLVKGKGLLLSKLPREPGSQASSRGEAKDSALLSSRDAGLLEPPERRGTLGSSLRSPAEGEGHEGFPPPPDKDLEPFTK